MSGSGPTRRIEDWKPPNSGNNESPGAGNGDKATVKIGTPPPPGGPGVPGGNQVSGQNTVIAGSPQPAGLASPAQTPQHPAHREAAVPIAQDFMNDPVVGWLVITNGPGKGMGLPLGKGMNTIGRGSENRVVINYGDSSISRDKHCVVTFEPKRSVFFIHNEGGTNLTYVGDAVVLQAQQLHNAETIQIGETEMRFVAFCGEDFSWDSNEE
ncbi:MAG: FHA domain-containing protein [Pseudomonadota bacterium]